MNINKYNITNTALFLVGIMCLLLAPFSNAFTFLALTSFGGGVFMIGLMLHKSYKKFKKDLDYKKKEILLELAVEEDGDKYVLAGSPFSKSQERFLKSEQRSKLITVLITYFISLCLLFLAIRMLF